MKYQIYTERQFVQSFESEILESAVQKKIDHFKRCGMDVKVQRYYTLYYMVSLISGKVKRDSHKVARIKILDRIYTLKNRCFTIY
jgi:hypothetical protein